MPAHNKPFAPSAEENKAAILAVIQPLLANARHLLEIGGGTGQHAVFFASAMPHLRWQTSDLGKHLPGIRRWLDEAALPNLPQPIALDVGGDWPAQTFDAVFSANTAHIMPAPQVADMLRGVGRVLGSGGCFLLYGPFNEGGRYTGEGNRSFDAWLKEQDPRMGLRNLEDLEEIGRQNGLRLLETKQMPANNRILVWIREPQG
ncbi:DUF938 domain-containing protein [Thiorhodococcus mannitoliphagus]|uniref:DUF938 domain-containing protein n=1 Tax=Thiorhodococcus mannitoliphagus TaxID=329406 RepID=A0A6P1E0I7_9GAMM|nr:DUF938 domain-containing protein [Thiorhodococcus mannitoliphagus]NEX21962.1 DUF938 domain-containing protein [Thiorhodococcus mannitoliphagus]